MALFYSIRIFPIMTDSVFLEIQKKILKELLLSRIELLESQLLTYLNAKNAASPKNAQTTSTNCVEKEEEVNQLKREIRELIEDRAKSEQLAKESIRFFKFFLIKLI